MFKTRLLRLHLRLFKIRNLISITLYLLINIQLLSQVTERQRDRKQLTNIEYHSDNSSVFINKLLPSATNHIDLIVELLHLIW